MNISNLHLRRRVACAVYNASSSLRSQIQFKSEISRQSVVIKVFLSEEGFETLRERDEYFQILYEAELKDPETHWSKGQVGEFSAHIGKSRDRLNANCQSDLEKADQIIGEKVSFFIVDGVYLINDLTGMGIGTDLYIKAAKEISRYNAVLIPEKCKPAGVTSPAAARVWESSKIKQKLKVIGTNVFWGGN